MQNGETNKNKLGQSAVEMAMLLPILMVLMMGVMDFARLYWTQSVVRDAAYEGARMAILPEVTNVQVEATVLSELNIGGVESPPSVSVGERQAEQPVDVTVSVPFAFLAIDSFIPALDDISEVSATAVMTHER